jgi:NhaP-type Na+/H+ or K+/H+ antiporter
MRHWVAVVLWMLAALGSIAPASAAPPSVDLLYAYNRQNPRWEAGRSGGKPEVRKPYKPLRQPPGALPERQRGSSQFASQRVLFGLASIFILGVAAEWLSSVAHLPSLLLLLTLGCVAGPATGLLQPDVLLGNLLLPLVSLALAVMLFQQGLSMRRADLDATAATLLSLGVLIAWLISAVAAHFVLGLSGVLAALLGAILVMSGAAATGPLLGTVRPRAAVASTLHWESVGLDLIGTTAAILTLETILAGGGRQTALPGIAGVFETALIAAAIGGLGAVVFVGLHKQRWVPERLDHPLSLMLVVGAFTAANSIQEESGLLAAIVMGVALANQRSAGISALRESPGPSVLLAAAVMIVLAARLDVTDVAFLGLLSPAFVAIVLLIARPAAVALSTARSGFAWSERLWLSWAAPRGVVAAAVASICGLRLVEIGYPQAERIVPLAFLVIGVAAVVCGLTASAAAKWLGVAAAQPQAESQPAEPRSPIVRLIRERR